MNKMLHNILQRLKPWAFPMVAWLILSLMSMWCNYSISNGITMPLASLNDGIWLVWLWWMIPPRYRQWWLIIPFLFAGLLTANVCFNRFFHNAIPVEFIFTSESYNGFTFACGMERLQPADAIYLIGFLGIVAAWIMLRRHTDAVYSWRRCAIVTLSALVTSLAVHCYSAVRVWQNTQQTLPQSFCALWRAEVDYFNDIQRHGMVLTYAYHTMRLICPYSQLTDEELAQVQQMIDAPRPPLPPELATAFTANKHKNLIVIVVESLNSSLLNSRVNGITVTPTLDSIAADSTVISFPSIRCTTGFGGSSDGQLILLSGLASNKDMALNYQNPRATYPSIAANEQFARSIAIIGESSAIWQAYRYLPAAGIDEVFDNIVPGANVNADEAIFRAALGHINNTPSPLFALITTLSMHPPFQPGRVPATDIRKARMPNDRKYFTEAANYTDRCIADFLAALKVNNLYDNSVIVIVADHCALMFEKEPIPMFILNSGAPHRITADRALTQLDIYPTLLDVMGMADTDYWPGMGQSALRPGLTPLTDDELYRRSVLSQRLLENDYFRKK